MTKDSGGCESCHGERKCLRKLKKVLKRRLPITTWLPSYTKHDLLCDLIAGVTVGLTVVPQSMAYAAIAGLTPEYGLYSSYIGVFVYILLGSCRQSTVGPAAILNLILFQTCGQEYPECVVLTTFYSGIFTIIMAFLQLGWIVSFISEPVTIGFTAGASITIITSQINSLLGLQSTADQGFIAFWMSLFKNLENISVGDSVLGIGSLIILHILQKLGNIGIKFKPLKRVLWLLSVCRNAIIIMATSLAAYLWQTPPFKIKGPVNGGLPSFSLPQFELTYAPYRVNGTLVEPEERYTFAETWDLLKTGPLIVAILGVLQNVAISKAFGAGQAVDASQEMFSLSLTNILGGLLSSMPICASFSRSAVNENSGVKTQMSGLFSGILVLLSLKFLTESFYWIPKASLAAVIISAVVGMIDIGSLLPMWQISKIDVVSCLTTFIVAVGFGMEYGILAGVALSVVALLRRNYRPEVNSIVKLEPTTGTKYVLFQPKEDLTFPSVDFIATRIQKMTVEHKNCALFILDFSVWSNCDYTAASTFVSICKGMKRCGKTLAFLGCNEACVTALATAGMDNVPNVSNETDSLAEFICKNALKAKETETTNGSVTGAVSSDTIFSLVSNSKSDVSLETYKVA